MKLLRLFLSPAVFGKKQLIYIYEKIYRYIYYLIIISLFKVAQLLPYKTAVKFGGFLGLVAYYVIKVSREPAIINLKNSFPEKSPEEIRLLAKNIGVKTGKNIFEFLYYPKLSSADLGRIVEIENENILADAVKKGKGVLLASAHCGNWEFLGAAMASKGYPVNVIAKKSYLDRGNKMLLNFRISKGLKIIFRDQSDTARKMLKALKNGEILALLIDQDTSVPGVFVNFFSRLAWTPSGLATLALKTEAKVVLALDARLPDDRHKVVITPIEISKTGNFENDVLKNTQHVTSLIENHIRQYPDQWVWWHKRWKTRPS
ncbi:MAG: lysophospholipid acyltransferase family protein [Elusimicrobia bacterium]|nr:lysophospholipid acyltransferase family protein [Elusimicrobiota bacterium]